MADNIGPGLLLHVHLFKCAGTTCEQILQGSLGDRWAAIEPSEPGGWVPFDDIEAQVAQSQRIKAVSSHAPALTEQQWRSEALRTIVFIRHPLDRMHSAYEFQRIQKGAQLGPSAKLAAEKTFPEWVEQQLKGGGSHQVRNFACARLRPYSDLPVERRRPADDTDLAFAKETLDRAEVAGATDQCSQVWAAYARTPRGAWLQRRLAGTWANSRGRFRRRPSLERRLVTVQDALGKTMFDDVMALNGHDEALYKYATTIDARTSGWKEARR